jgi:ectoine hydroxylase-related dioxygenase (phytanoyl-CoA dioxygenase family)
MSNENIFSLEYAKNHLDKVVKEIYREGVVVIKDVFSEIECNKTKDKLNKVLRGRLVNNHYCGNSTNQVLDNYFMDDHSLLSLIYQDITDQLMRRLIDDDYVLISPSARNRSNLIGEEFGKKTSGFGWHTDSRFIGGLGVKPSLCYMSIVCIESFTKENGCTHYVPKSHLFYERPRDREIDIPYAYLTADKGDLVIFDTALWHKVGDASTISRWGVFNTYGPWFMKPYHYFVEMFNKGDSKEFSPVIRQLLHYDSTPPRDHNESMITLRRVREFLKK